MTYHMNDVFDAIELATSAHKGQTDKSGMPYIAHPIAVMTKCFRDELTMIVAVLHDVIEDTNVSLDTIRLRFGTEVADAVDAISRRDGEGYWEYLARCRRNDIAKRVKVADLDHNMEPSRAFGDGKEWHSMQQRYIKSLAFILNDESEGYRFD